MKLDLEVCIMRAPGEKEEDLSHIPSPSTSTKDPSSTAPSEPTPRLDLAAELEALQQEVDPDDSDDDDSDGLPDDLKNRQTQNIWDNPDMRWTLGIGGTVFFVPDAERYANAPSLPPPPPPSLQGRHRLHLKPRLPLDISNHRYRDEHPNIWPDHSYSPLREDKRVFEQKLLTMDFYASCNRALATLPPLEREKDRLRHGVSLGRAVEQGTRRSEVWHQHLEKRRLRKKAEASRAAALRVKAADQQAAADAKTNMNA